MSLPLETNCELVKSHLDDDQQFLLLDCREPDEWDTAKIDGAVLLPMSELQDRASELAAYREQPIVVYCHHGVRSRRVAGWLRDQGYPQVQSMTGGIDQWSQAIDESVPRY